MVLHNPNNWHWVDKNCLDWAKTYFDEHLVGVSASSGGSTAEITQVASLTGDVDVNQRKGKVISLFDVKLVLNYSGTVGSENVAGTITVPEVAYDTEPDEYVFEVAITAETREMQPMRELIRSLLVPKLRTLLSKFGPDLIETHGKDIQHPVTENESRFTSSNQRAGTAAGGTVVSSSSLSATAKAASNSPAYNTTTLRLDPVFNTTAAELYTTFVDPGRVAAWTRSQPVKFTASEGGEYAMFGGNVSGKFVKLVKDKKIEMTWRLKDWKPEHFADLEIVFDQGQGETRAIVTWSGVPIGQEDITRQNFEEYYVKSIKLTFGFGAVL
ncbi:activator of Hsp90 ATPase [Limtongia smithiae]|uniref:activator of Hsp90 ATPase n=1 Tax=Limtongia smithiae TaxID=1125753 RepID=UPI0034CFB503